ncbi:MAG TPA: M14 family metallopeptidase [Longimicrobiales bacterium]|nr:M14 family metallopeptidase [Longimicrobiales bacterium]
MNVAFSPRSGPRRSGIPAALAACAILIAAPSATAQRVPITFNDFHGYDGTVDYLRKVAGAHRDITELVEIGRSNQGRPIYVLVISRQDNGATIDRYVTLTNPRAEGVDNVTPMKSWDGKPGFWIDGGTHGNEYTGTEVALYIIDKLVSGYASDPAIKALVDANTFYVCPIVNPDGVFNSVQKGISQRQNSMEVDDDGDGKTNEDGPDDLNGDGKYTSFRYPDPEGRWIKDPKDARVMIQLGDDDKTDQPRFSVISEDRDNDGDGKRGEDSERGIDVNRNFPEGWADDDLEQRGSGYYPSSAPESHAILEFFTNHTNILMVQSYHTSGGFTYRPFARWPDRQIAPKDLAVFDKVMGPRYIALHPGEKDPKQLWRPPYRGDRPYGYGIFLDWAYAQFGAYAMSTELWSWSRDTRELPGFNAGDDRAAWERALLAHQETAFGGKLFVPWRAYTHPELGQGEVGGWVTTYVGGNALPGASLEHVADVHWQFELFKAGLLPKLAITEAKAETLSSSGGTRVVKVTAKVANTGPLATHVARGSALAGNRPDAIWLVGDRGRVKFLQGSPWLSLGVLEGAMEIPGWAPEPGGGGSTREVSWLVALEGSPSLKLVLTSQKGGTHVREVPVR